MTLQNHKTVKLAECITLWGKPERVYAYEACISLPFECNSTSGCTIPGTKLYGEYMRYEQIGKHSGCHYAVAPMTVAIEEQR